jgi:hypothetical protein
MQNERLQMLHVRHKWLNWEVGGLPRPVLARSSEEESTYNYNLLHLLVDNLRTDYNKPISQTPPSKTIRLRCSRNNDERQIEIE